MDREKRQHILKVALRHFANRGYAGTSVQEIVDDAKVAKPMLYYYFESKAKLYQALIDSACEERLRVLTEAAACEGPLEERLGATLLALFRFIKKNREAVRLAFATAFAAPGELPAEVTYRENCRRSFDFFDELMGAAQEAGEVSRDFSSQELAMSWYGVMNIYVMGQLLQPDISYDEQTARSIVDLFFRGAAAKGRKKGAGASLTGRTGGYSVAAEPVG